MRNSSRMNECGMIPRTNSGRYSRKNPEESQRKILDKVSTVVHREISKGCWIDFQANSYVRQNL